MASPVDEQEFGERAVTLGDEALFLASLLSSVKEPGKYLVCTKSAMVSLAVKYSLPPSETVNMGKYVEKQMKAFFPVSNG